MTHKLMIPHLMLWKTLAGVMKKAINMIALNTLQIEVGRKRNTGDIIPALRLAQGQGQLSHSLNEPDPDPDLDPGAVGTGGVEATIDSRTTIQGGTTKTDHGGTVDQEIHSQMTRTELNKS